jgi:hypothetical protein
MFVLQLKNVVSCLYVTEIREAQIVRKYGPSGVAQAKTDKHIRNNWFPFHFGSFETDCSVLEFCYAVSFKDSSFVLIYDV